MSVFDPLRVTHCLLHARIDCLLRLSIISNRILSLFDTRKALLIIGNKITKYAKLWFYYKTKRCGAVIEYVKIIMFIDIARHVISHLI